VRPERSIAGRFSVPIAESGAVAIVQVGDPRSIVELDRAETTLAVNAGGHLERATRARFQHATINAVSPNEAVLAELLEGRVDAVITDSLEAPHWIARAHRHSGGIRVTTIGPFTKDRKAWLIRADQPALARAADRWLLAREADGSLAGLREQFLGQPGPETASAFSALVAAIDERLSLMPAVANAKRAKGAGVQDATREERVIAAGIDAVSAAAREAKTTAPPEAVTRSFYRALIEAAKTIQGRTLTAARAEDAIDADLTEELRPALLRIGEKIALLVVAAQGSEAMTPASVTQRLESALERYSLPKKELEAIAQALSQVLPRAAGAEGS